MLVPSHYEISIDQCKNICSSDISPLASDTDFDYYIGYKINGVGYYTLSTPDTVIYPRTLTLSDAPLRFMLDNLFNAPINGSAFSSVVVDGNPVINQSRSYYAGFLGIYLGNNLQTLAPELSTADYRVKISSLPSNPFVDYSSYFGVDASTYIEIYTVTVQYCEYSFTDEGQQLTASTGIYGSNYTVDKGNFTRYGNYAFRDYGFAHYACLTLSNGNVKMAIVPDTSLPVLSPYPLDTSSSLSFLYTFGNFLALTSDDLSRFLNFSIFGTPWFMLLFGAGFIVFIGWVIVRWVIP